MGLSNSETGVDYQLKIGGVNTGSSVVGTGSAISFGNQSTAGAYTVDATRISGGCTNTMTGSVDVSVLPRPVASATLTNITCNGAEDGTITVEASGGTGPYTFSVNGSDFLGPTDIDERLFENLSPDTPYHPQVKGSKGCISK